MNTLKKIWEWIKKNKSFILIGLLVLFVALFLNECVRKNADKKVYEQNLYAANDTIHQERTKNGKLEYEKGILVTTEKELKQQNKELYDELQVEKGKVKEIIIYKIKLVHDTLYLHDTIYNDANGNYILAWDYYKKYDAYNYDSIAGQTKLHIDTTCNPIYISTLGSMITKNVVGMKFVTGVKTVNKKLNIFIRSDYPGFIATDIEGADLSKSKELKKYKRWCIGPAIGVGIGTSLKIEPFIGICISYSVIRF
jgi:hypothetical protein